MEINLKATLALVILSAIGYLLSRLGAWCEDGPHGRILAGIGGMFFSIGQFAMTFGIGVLGLGSLIVVITLLSRT